MNFLPGPAARGRLLALPRRAPGTATPPFLYGVNGSIGHAVSSSTPVLPAPAALPLALGPADRADVGTARVGGWPTCCGRGRRSLRSGCPPPADVAPWRVCFRVGPTETPSMTVRKVVLSTTAITDLPLDRTLYNPPSLKGVRHLHLAEFELSSGRARLV
jgi:hypothetical protein